MIPHPISPVKRRRLESLIRLIDLVVYLAVMFGGIYAVAFTPPTVEKELSGFEGLVVLWGSLLLVGGLVGFVGRLSRYWILEVPATPVAAIGILIYFVILGKSAFSTVNFTVATLLVLVALLTMVRRYLELQIFATDPDQVEFKIRLVEALKRRTPDMPERTH